MPRKAKGGRRGASNWAKGTQLPFLESRKDTWEDCENKKERSQFYADVAILFVNKYGWDLQDNDDPDPDESDIASIRKALTGEGTEEKQKQHAAELATLRAVSQPCLG
jgi:hypothetical protein